MVTTSTFLNADILLRRGYGGQVAVNGEPRHERNRPGPRGRRDIEGRASSS